MALDSAAPRERLQRRGFVGTPVGMRHEAPSHGDAEGPGVVGKDRAERGSEHECGDEALRFHTREQLVRSTVLPFARESRLEAAPTPCDAAQWAFAQSLT